MSIDDPTETLGASAGRPVSSGALRVWQRRSVFKGLGAKNCPFVALSPRQAGRPGGKELKARHKELKAKA